MKPNENMTWTELEQFAKDKGIIVDKGVNNVYYAYIEKDPFWQIRFIWNDPKTISFKMFNIIKNITETKD